MKIELLYPNQFINGQPSNADEVEAEFIQIINTLNNLDGENIKNNVLEYTHLKGDKRYLAFGGIYQDLSAIPTTFNFGTETINQIICLTLDKKVYVGTLDPILQTYNYTELILNEERFVEIESNIENLFDLLDTKEKKIYEGTIEPDNPSIGDKWLDIGNIPNTMRRFNGSSWVVIGVAGSGATINDDVASQGETWSSYKIKSEVDVKANIENTYTKDEVDRSLSAKLNKTGGDILGDLTIQGIPVLKLGDLNFGNYGIDISNTDLNKLHERPSGYYVGNNLTNSPDYPRYFNILQLKWSDLIIYQILFRQSPTNFHEIYIRTIDPASTNIDKISEFKQLKTYGNPSDFTRIIPTATEIPKGVYTKINGLTYTVKKDCNLSIRGNIALASISSTSTTMLFRYAVNGDYSQNERFLYNDLSGTGKTSTVMKFDDVYISAKKGDVITLWAYATDYASSITSSAWNHVIFEEK